MMKATSRPSSNQPMESSGHSVMKCRTSSRCSGHSPDTEMKAGRSREKASKITHSCARNGSPLLLRTECRGAKYQTKQTKPNATSVELSNLLLQMEHDLFRTQADIVLGNKDKDPRMCRSHKWFYAKPPVGVTPPPPLPRRRSGSDLWRSLTFSLDLKHADRVLRVERPHLAGGQRVPPLDAGRDCGRRLHDVDEWLRASDGHRMAEQDLLPPPPP